MDIVNLYNIMENIDKKYIFIYTIYNKKLNKKYFTIWKNMYFAY